MNPRVSWYLLIAGYGLLAALYLVAVVTHTIENSTGNRAIGAAIAFSYFSVFVLGLIKWPRVFSLLSVGNFAIGSAFVGYIFFWGGPGIHYGLLVYLSLGIMGAAISLKAGRSRNEL